MISIPKGPIGSSAVSKRPAPTAIKRGPYMPFKLDPNHKGPLKPRKIFSSEFEERIVKTKRVAKTSKGGRQSRIWVFVVIGDKKGRVGYGIGKARDFPMSLRQAVKNAKKNIIRVKINVKGSVFHEYIGRCCASRVLLKPGREGTGIVAGGAVKSVLELAGYKNIYSKSLGSNNSVNVVRACFESLLSQRSPAEVSILRDRNFKELFHL